MYDVVVDSDDLLAVRTGRGTHPVVMARDTGAGASERYRLHATAVARPRGGTDTHLTPAEVRQVAIELREQLAGDPDHATLCREIAALVAVPDEDAMVVRQVCTIVYRELWRRRQLLERQRPRTRYCPRHLDDDSTFALVAEIVRGTQQRADLPLDRAGNPQLVDGALRMRTETADRPAVVWVGETRASAVGPRLRRACDREGWLVV